LKDYTEPGAGEATAAAASYGELQQLTSAVLTSYMLSLDGAQLQIADPAAVSAEEVLLQRDQIQRVKEAISKLPENNRLLIEQYYFHDETLEEIGNRLGLSKSWVCRLHAKSLDMLRDLMSHTTERPTVSNLGSENHDNKSGNVRRQVSAVPDITAFAPLRDRLNSIESDFNASAKLLDGNVSLNDDGKLLEMQMQMYKMTENVEVLSRTVSEVGSGVKTILQTQV
jgi:hypothetical protein